MGKKAKAIVVDGSVKVDSNIATQGPNMVVKVTLQGNPKQGELNSMAYVYKGHRKTAVNDSKVDIDLTLLDDIPKLTGRIMAHIAPLIPAKCLANDIGIVYTNKYTKALRMADLTSNTSMVIGHHLSDGMKRWVINGATRFFTYKTMLDAIEKHGLQVKRPKSGSYVYWSPESNAVIPTIVKVMTDIFAKV